MIGGAVGNQIGRGSGRAVATTLGVVGGALIGRAMEQQLGQGGYSQDVYRVTVRLDQGGIRTVDYLQPPNVRVGDRVRIEGNQIYR